MRWVLVVSIWMMVGAGVAAQDGPGPVPGTGAPAFVAARALWLEGEDMAAAAALSGLAAAGNAAAQILLAQIERDPALRPTGTEALSRAERIALLRAPGGLSGTSWLSVAAATQPLAGALSAAGSGLAMVDPPAQRRAIEVLLAAGETRAALGLMGTFVNTGGFGADDGWTLTVEYGAHPALDGHGIAALELLRRLAANPDAGLHMPELAATLAAQVSALDAGTGDAAPFAAWGRGDALAGDAAARAEAAAEVAKARHAAPLLAVCAAVCPQSQAGCTLAMAMGVAGMPGYLTLSPFEGAISSADYQASPRFAGDLRRRLAQAAPLLARHDACAGDWAAG